MTQPGCWCREQRRRGCGAGPTESARLLSAVRLAHAPSPRPGLRALLPRPPGASRDAASLLLLSFCSSPSGLEPTESIPASGPLPQSFKKRLFIWPHRVLAVACGRFSCSPQTAWLLHMGSSSLSRNRTRTPCAGSSESQSLDQQGSPCPGTRSRAPRGRALLDHRASGPPQRSPPGSAYPASSPLLLHFCAFFTAGNSYLLAFLWRDRPTRTATGRCCPSLLRATLPASSWHRSPAQSRCSANIQRPEACRWLSLELGSHWMFFAVCFDSP